MESHISALPRVLIVDDEETIVDLVRGYLNREGWEVAAVDDGRAALAAVRDTAPDVVVLDLMLPGLDGIEVCRQLRTFSDAYVIMLTARSEEIDRVVGLSVGAVVYLTKPFSPRELVARIKALLRRPRSATTRARLGGSGLSVDLARRGVYADGRPVALTNTEFELLATLVRDPGVVVTRQQLLDRVWGADYYGDDHVLDVHVGNLRRKLGDDPDHPRWIETVRAIGFRFVGAEG
jgi:DNA-binding response OmpR family regulator